MLVEMSISNNTAFAISDACDEGSEWNSIVLWSFNMRNLSSSISRLCSFVDSTSCLFTSKLSYTQHVHVQEGSAKEFVYSLVQ